LKPANIQRPLWYIDFYEPLTNQLNLSNNICYDPVLIAKLDTPIDHNVLFRYPDAVETYRLLSSYYHIDSKNIAVGYGSGELLLRIMQQFSGYSIGLHTPTYELAYAYARNVSSSVITSSDIESIDTDILYIANPNGITGQALTKEKILLLAKKYKYLIVDEAYGDFNTISCSVLAESILLDNLLVVKTLSKTVASPGLRIGYCFSNKQMITAIQNCRPSTVVTGITSYFVSMLLPAVSDHLARMLATRDYIESKYDCIPSQGNFVLFKNNPKLNCKIKKTSQGLHRMALTDIDTFKRLENE